MNKISATNLKFKRSFSTLDDILSYQRSPLVKTGLGYGKEETTEDFKLPEKKTEEKTRSYAEILKSLKHGEESKKEASPKQGSPSHHDRPRRTMSQRRPLVPRYEKTFYGYCYSCNKLGHEAVNCKSWDTSIQCRTRGICAYVKCYNQHHYDHIARDCRNKLNNIFECYNCHVYGHIARDCRQMINKVWRRKEQVQATENNLSREEKGKNLEDMSANTC